MELEFLSEAYVAELNKRMQDSERFRKEGKGWKSSMTFALMAEADKGIEPGAVILALADGKGTATRVMGPGPYEGEYVIRGVSAKWKELLTKQIFPVPALMSGQLQLVKGSQMSLMMKMGATQAILDEVAEIPTKFPG